MRLFLPLISIVCWKSLVLADSSFQPFESLDLTENPINIFKTHYRNRIIFVRIKVVFLSLKSGILATREGRCNNYWLKWNAEIGYICIWVDLTRVKSVLLEIFSLLQLISKDNQTPWMLNQFLNVARATDHFTWYYLYLFFFFCVYLNRPLSS